MLSGMSCGGCVNGVKNALLKHPDIQEAVVELNPQTATLTMDKFITTEELQNHLSKIGNYKITELASD